MAPDLLALALDPTVVAAAIVTVFGAVTLFVNSVLTKIGENAKSARADTAALSVQLALLQGQTNVIEGHVNSAATRNAAIIAAQEQQLGMLRDQIADLKQTALLLAQSKAVKAVDTVTGSTLAAHDLWEKGEREKTTADIAENTALTREIRDAVVPAPVTKVEITP